MTFSFTYPYPAPSTKGWGPGYPDCQRDKIEPHPIFVGGVRSEVRELVDLLVAESERRGFEFVNPGCWGFGCRGMKTSSGDQGTTPSVHSWGLAVDINAPRNVFGAARSTSEIATKFPWLPGLWQDYGFFWLGPSIGDWMHFHFAGSPEDAESMTAKARKNLGDAMTDDERKEFKELKKRVLYLERLAEGYVARLQGEPEPGKPGPKRKGWRQADAFLGAV